MKTFETKNEVETIKLAKHMVKNLPKDIHVIVLEGTLGAGKTTFTKGIALALDIKRPINSPTYTILKIYEGTKPLYHFDLYRLFEEGFDFDLEEYIDNKDALSVVEWAEKVPSFIPDQYVKVSFEYVTEDIRNISIQTVGTQDSWEVKLSELYF